MKKQAVILSIKLRIKKLQERNEQNPFGSICDHRERLIQELESQLQRLEG